MLEIKKGLKIGKLTLIQEGERKILPSGLKIRTVDCLCDCGNKKNILLLHFVRERTISCGCVNKCRGGVSNTKLYRIYTAIKERCSGKTKDSARYLGRGITVCAEWQKNHLSFINWALLNGYEEGLQIDRKDNNNGYSPENCRWVTSLINNNNRENTFRVVYLNKNYAFFDLIRKLNLENSASTIRRRIKRGWSIEDAFNIPIKKGNYNTK